MVQVDFKLHLLGINNEQVFYFPRECSLKYYLCSALNYSTIATYHSEESAIPNSCILRTTNYILVGNPPLFPIGEHCTIFLA